MAAAPPTLTSLPTLPLLRIVSYLDHRGAAQLAATHPKLWRERKMLHFFCRPLTRTRLSEMVFTRSCCRFEEEPLMEDGDLDDLEQHMPLLRAFQAAVACWCANSEEDVEEVCRKKQNIFPMSVLFRASYASLAKYFKREDSYVNWSIHIPRREIDFCMKKIMQTVGEKYGLRISDEPFDAFDPFAKPGFRAGSRTQKEARAMNLAAAEYPATEDEEDY